MGLFDRVARVVKANLDDLASKADDPEWLLENSIMEMQEDLVQLRQGVRQAIATQKRTEEQYIQAENNANEWLRQAQLAVQKGDDNLARQQLHRKKTFTETAITLKQSLDRQTATIETLKQNIQALESKIVEAKTKKDMLKARIQQAKKQEQLDNISFGGIGSDNFSATSAFERMEEKVLMMETRANQRLPRELQGTELDAKLKALEEAANALNDKFFVSTEQGPVQVKVQVKIEVTVTGLEKTLEERFKLLDENIDDELAMLLGTQGLNSSKYQPKSPITTNTNSQVKPSLVVDPEELEELRRQLNQM